MSPLSPSHPKPPRYLHVCMCVGVCVYLPAGLWFKNAYHLKDSVAGLFSRLVSKRCFKCLLESPSSQFLYIFLFLRVESTVNDMSEHESWHAIKMITYIFRI